MRLDAVLSDPATLTAKALRLVVLSAASYFFAVLPGRRSAERVGQGEEGLSVCSSGANNESCPRRHINATPFPRLLALPGLLRTRRRPTTALLLSPTVA